MIDSLLTTTLAEAIVRRQQAIPTNDYQAEIRWLTQTLQRRLEHPVTSTPPGDYDSCVWLHSGALALLEASTTELRTYLATSNQPLSLLDVGLSVWGRLGAVRWRVWTLNAEHKLVATKRDQPLTLRAVQERTIVRQALHQSGIRLLSAATLRQPVAANTMLDSPPTVATILFSEAW